MATTAEIIESKTEIIIEMIMKEMNLSLIDATNLWYKSNTRRVMLSRGMLVYVGAPVCVDELRLELEKSSSWMAGQFI